MKDLVKTKIYQSRNDNPYPKMEGDSPFARRFNELQSQAWVITNQSLPVEDLIMQILIEDYNDKNSIKE